MGKGLFKSPIKGELCSNGKEQRGEEGLNGSYVLVARWEKKKGLYSWWEMESDISLTWQQGLGAKYGFGGQCFSFHRIVVTHPPIRYVYLCVPLSQNVDYFGTKPLSPLLELSIHNDREGVFFLPFFFHTKGTVLLFLLLSFGGHRVYRIPFWWVMRWQLQLGWRQACLSEKSTLSHRDLEHWRCGEAPTCHHREARKKAMFLFYKVSLDTLQK